MSPPLADAANCSTRAAKWSACLSTASRYSTVSTAFAEGFSTAMDPPGYVPPVTSSHDRTSFPNTAFDSSCRCASEAWASG